MKEKKMSPSKKDLPPRCFFCGNLSQIYDDPNGYHHVNCPRCKKYHIHNSDLDETITLFDPFEIPIAISDWLCLNAPDEEIKLDVNKIDKILDYYRSLSNQDQCDILLLYLGKDETVLSDCKKMDFGSLIGSCDEGIINSILGFARERNLINYYGWNITDSDITIILTKKGRTRYNKLKRENRSILNFHNEIII